MVAEEDSSDAESSEAGKPLLFDFREEWGKPDGDVYGVVELLATDGTVPGITPLSLPETIYGATVAVLLLLPDSPSRLQVLSYVTPMLAYSVLCLVMQAWTTLAIAGMVRANYENKDPDASLCEGGDFYLRLICLGVYTVLMLNSCKTSMDMHRWMARLPTVKQHQMLRMQKFIDNSEQSPDDEGFGAEYMSVNKVVTGMTVSERILAYGLLIGKSFVEVTLLYYGSAYIMFADTDENLILNAVALFFVVEIADYLYTFVTNRSVMAYLSNMPQVGLTVAEVKDSRMGDLDDAWMLLSGFLLAVFTAALYKNWCAA